MRKQTWVSCLILAHVTACTIVDETGSSQDVSDAGPSDEGGAEADALPAEPDGVAESSDATDAAIDGDAGVTPFDPDALFDVALDGAPVGPDGDSGLVLGGDGGDADGAFQLKSPVGTNLLSQSDVRPTCTTLDGATAATYVMICVEMNGTGQPCRTVTVSFAGVPTPARVYASIATAVPAEGESVVQYQEAADCTSATTNTWIEAETGGDFTIDVLGDTGFEFTLHDVPLSPAPTPDATSQNATGTFTLAGSGLSSFPFDSTIPSR